MRVRLQYLLLVSLSILLSSTVFAQRQSDPPIYTVIRDTLGVSGDVSAATTANSGLYTHQGALGAITGASIFNSGGFAYSFVHGSIVQTNSIRGTINDADGVPITDMMTSEQAPLVVEAVSITGGMISVQAYIGDPCGDHQLVTEAFADENGMYVLSGLFPGDYFLRLNTVGAAYIAEWYDNANGVFNCLGASLINVTLTNDVPGKDFFSDRGTLVSGNVLTTGAAPIKGVQVGIFKVRRPEDLITFGETDVSGAYTVNSALPSGLYFARTRNNLGFVDKSYCSISDCSGSSEDFIVVPNAVVTINNVDFGLETGETISGRVIDEINGDGLSGITVKVYDASGEQELSSTKTNIFGNYVTTGLIAGAGPYHARTVNRQSYINELFGGQDCIGNCDRTAGTPISITTRGTTEQNIDFTLAKGGSISGTITDADPPNHSIRGIRVDIYPADVASFSSIDIVTSGTSDINGNYHSESGLPSGDYLAVTSDSQFYRSQLFGGTCSSSGCDPTTGMSIGVISGQETTGFDFSLQQKFRAVKISACVDHGSEDEKCIAIDDGDFLSRDCGLCRLRIEFNEDVQADSVSDLSSVLSLQTDEATPDIFTVYIDPATSGLDPVDAKILDIKFTGSLPDVDMTAFVFALTPAILAASDASRLSVDLDIRFSVLIGEVNGAQPVNIGDLVAALGHIDGPVTVKNAKYDIDNDGIINIVDLIAIRDRLGNMVP
jgi:hypothetical protein